MIKKVIEERRAEAEMYERALDELLQIKDADVFVKAWIGFVRRPEQERSSSAQSKIQDLLQLLSFGETQFSLAMYQAQVLALQNEHVKALDVLQNFNETEYVREKQLTTDQMEKLEE